MVLIGLVSAGTNLFAASLTVNPPLVMNDYVGQVSLAISGLTSGKRVLVERFIDANSNGVVDAGDDPLTFSFKVTDGQVPLIGGVRNANVPGDDDGATTGSIRVDLPFPNVDAVVGSAAVNFIFRVSDPQNGFSPVTATFDVQQRSQPQGVSGRITAAAGGTPLPRAFVLLNVPNGSPIAAMLTDDNGNYSFNAAPGSYSVIVIRNGYVSDQTAGAVTVIANQFATRNLALASAGFTISGKISDRSSGVNIAGVLVLADFQSTNDLVAAGLSDANGNYSFSVTAGQWRVTPDESQLAQVGYVGVQDVTINATANGAGTIDFPVPKASALIYGTVKDGANNSVIGVEVEANDQGDLYRTEGFTFSPNSNYATGVVAGTWSVGVEPNNLIARGYIGTPSEVTLNAGQAVQVNFVVQAITAHLRGQIRDDSGTPIPNMTIVLQPVPFPPNGVGSIYPMTDSNGNFDVGLRGGTWNIALECEDAQDRGYVNDHRYDFVVIDGIDQNNLVLTFPVFTATITGSVRDTFGQPIAGVDLDASQNSYDGGCVTTDANGNYIIKVLGGSWNVAVRNEELNARGFNDVASQNVTISGGTATANFVATPLPPEIISPTSAAGTVGQQFVYQFETRFATSRNVTNLPPGLAFTPGLSAITGTPTAAGVFQSNLSAIGGGGTTNATLTITIQPAPTSGPVIVGSTAAKGRTGQFFSLHVVTTGGSPTARLSASGLPPGLNADPIAGVISGIPTSDGSFPVTLTVTDGNSTTTSILQLTFTSDPALPVIVSPDRAALTPGAPFNYTIVAPSNAGPSDPTIFAKSGDLPAGLDFNAATGVISGVYAGPLRASSQGGSRKPDLSGGALLGSIQLFGTNSHGTSTIQLLFLPAPSGAVNIATRLLVGTGANVLIGGFIITGNAPKVVIVRAIGPNLANFGIANALQDPTLELHREGHPAISNDNWGTDAIQEQLIMGAGLAPGDDRESAIVAGLDPGPYTAIVAGKNGATGLALVEVFDLGTASLDVSGNARLGNISTRGFVDTGDDVMIGGFIIQRVATRVVVRAIGPSLSAFGINGALQDTTLELKNANGSTLIANGDWQQGQPVEIQQAGLAPSDPRESAVLATLAAGQYTAIVRGQDGITGVAVVEAYALSDQ